MEVKVKTTKARKMGGSCYISLKSFGVETGDILDIYRNEKGDIIIKKAV